MQFLALISFVAVAGLAFGLPAAAAGPSPGLSGDPAAGAPAQATGDPAQGFRTAPAAGAPGRRDDPPPAVPASPSGPGSDREREVARAFECDREKIVRMLRAAQTESEISSSFELEREVLLLCRDRWTVLEQIMDSELSLAAVLRTDRVARETAALELEERRRLARARVEGAREGAVEAARVAEERRLVVEGAPEAPEVTAAGGRREAPAPHERFTWFTMIGTGGSLRAGVTDGDGRWLVEPGDSLPGGVRVTSISARPARVRVAGGPPRGLPYRRLR